MAQSSPIVMGVSPRRTTDNTIVVNYELHLSSYKWCDVGLYVSFDGGNTYSRRLVKVSGDVGRITTHGRKSIVWRIMEEQEVITGEDIIFKIEVENYPGAPKELRNKFAKTAVQPKQATAKAKPAVPPAPVAKAKHAAQPKQAAQAKPIAASQPKPVKTKSAKPKSQEKAAFLIMPNIGVYPQLSYGLMAGWGKRAGFYVKFRSDFSSVKSTYNCMSDGTADGGYIWATGNVKKSRMVVTAGATFRAVKWLYPYIGVGYGSRTLAWEDVSGNWATVTDNSFKGVSIDAGLIFKFGIISVSVGYNNTAFKYSELEAGIGVMF